MSVSENLKSAVAARNIPDIRGGLWSCIAVDMNMTGRFQESLDYVLAHGISEEELYDTDDVSKTFSEEATIENFSKLGGLLRINFSKKKLDALRKMGRILYPPQEETEESKKKRANRQNKAVFAGASATSHSTRRFPHSKGEQAVCVAGGAVAVGGLSAFAAAKFGAKVGGIIGFGIFGAIISAGVGLLLASSNNNHTTEE